MARLYIDANVAIALLTQDALTPRARDLIEAWDGWLVLSDLAATEFASAVARKVRMGAMTASDARFAFENLDRWSDGQVECVRLHPSDMGRAASILRRLAWPIRTPDALHIATAERLKATLATFDVKLGQVARDLGVPVAP